MNVKRHVVSHVVSNIVFGSFDNVDDAYSLYDVLFDVDESCWVISEYEGPADEAPRVGGLHNAYPKFDPEFHHMETKLFIVHTDDEEVSRVAEMYIDPKIAYKRLWDLQQDENRSGEYTIYHSTGKIYVDGHIVLGDMTRSDLPQ